MKLVNKGIYILSFLLLSIPFACTEEEDDFSIIEGLNFTVATLNKEGTQAGVLPTTVPGDGRIVYTVDFGDPAESEKDVFKTSGPMVTYKYPKESATYTISVTASLDGKDDVSITKEHTVVYVDTSVPEPEASGLYDNFEGGGNIDWKGDGTNINASFANPYKTGNDTCGVLKYVDDGGQYANVGFSVSKNFDLSEDAVFKIMVYVESSSITGSQPNQISLKLQNGDLGEFWTTQTEIIKPLELDKWQEITFDFANDTFVNFPGSSVDDPVDRTDLNKVVIQLNSENNNDKVTAYLDEFSYGTKPTVAGAYANDDFEGCDGIASWKGDGTTVDKAFANPYPGGINTSAHVLKYVDDGGQYANVGFNVSPNFDLSENATFKIKVYVESSSITGSQPNQISFKLQNGDLGEFWTTQTEIIKPVVLDQWQEITFDFANDTFVNFPGSSVDDPVDRTDLNKVVIQLNSENNNDKVTAYLDDLIYEE